MSLTISPILKIYFAEKVFVKQQKTPSISSFKIADRSDAEAVVQLVNSSYRGEDAKRGWTTETDFLDGQRLDKEMFLDLISKPKCAILTFSKETKLVACVNVEYSEVDNSVYVGMVTVNPILQGAGLGSCVLETAEAFAVANWGASKSKMTVISQRSALIKFYEKRGYVDSKVRTPFPYGDERFGIPKIQGLEFAVFIKDL